MISRYILISSFLALTCSSVVFAAGDPLEHVNKIKADLERASTDASNKYAMTYKEAYAKEFNKYDEHLKDSLNIMNVPAAVYSNTQPQNAPSSQMWSSNKPANNTVNNRPTNNVNIFPSSNTPKTTMFP